MSVLRNIVVAIIVTPGGLVLAVMPFVLLYRRARGLTW